MGRIIDETGKRYGKLTVIKMCEPNKEKRAKWLCKCDCGNYTTVIGKSLRNGSTKSCGCHRKEVLKRGAAIQTTHGETNSKLYNVWRGIKKRCRLKSSPNYKWYGLKGIDVCDEWLNSYESFRDWSHKNGYKEGLTIDRINVMGDYTPQNCRWVNWKTQENNRGNTVYVKYNNRLYPRGVLAEKLGVTVQAIDYRQKNNIPIKDNFKI